MQPACSPGVLIVRGWSGPACTSLPKGLLLSCLSSRSSRIVRACKDILVCRPLGQLLGELTVDGSSGPACTPSSAGQSLSCLLSQVRSTFRTSTNTSVGRLLLRSHLLRRWRVSALAERRGKSSTQYANAKPALLFVAPPEVCCHDRGALGVCRMVTARSRATLPKPASPRCTHTHA